MPEKIQFELVSPAKLLVSLPVDMVVVPGSEGNFGALARHAPMITTVRPGVIDIHDEGKITNRIFVAGGFAEVNGERITVLAEEAIPLEDLSREMIDERLSKAQETLVDAKTDQEKLRAEKMMKIATAMQAATAS